MDDMEKAVGFVYDSIRKSKGVTSLYEMSLTAALKYGVPDVRSIMREVGKRFNHVSYSSTKLKWYTCCYKVVPVEGDVYFDIPHLKKNTSMKNIENLPVKTIQGCKVSSVAIHAYTSRSEAEERLQFDFNKHVEKWNGYLQRKHELEKQG